MSYEYMNRIWLYECNMCIYECDMTVYMNVFMNVHMNEYGIFLSVGS